MLRLTSRLFCCLGVLLGAPSLSLSQVKVKNLGPEEVEVTLEEQLFQAVEENDGTRITTLMLRGAEVDPRREEDGFTPLMVAVQAGKLSIAALLLENGADPNLRSTDVFRDPPLMYALNDKESLEMVRLLVDKGADVNAWNGTGKSNALMKAITLGESEIVRVLLEAGADVSAKNGKGANAVLRARASRDLDIQRMVRERWEQMRLSEPVTMSKLSEREKAVFELMLTEGASDAAVAARIGGFSQDGRFNPNARWPNGGHSLLMVAALKGMPQTAELLLQQGASVTARSADKWEQSVLFYAIQGPEPEPMVTLLLAHGADPNARRSRDKGTVLMSVCQRPDAETRLALADLLIAQGARPDYEDANGISAADLALEKGDRKLLEIFYRNYAQAPGTTVETLAAASTMEKDRATYTNTPRPHSQNPNRHRMELHLAVARRQLSEVQRLIKDGADVHALNRKGNSPLIEAADQLNLEMCGVLLAAGADPNQFSQNEMRGTALIYAAARMNSAPVVKLLLDRGAQPNVGMGEWGYTPLMLATALQEEQTVQLLLERGANPNLRAADGMTAMNLARRTQNEAIARRLAEAMEGESP